MKIILNILFCFTVLEVSAQGPDLLFAKGFGGPDGKNSNSMAIDKSNNIYIAGDFMNTADFDPGQGIANLSSAGVSDLFFAKYDASGNYIWSRRIGGTGRESVNSIEVDKVGNIYITGYFENTVDFNPGSAVNLLYAVGNGMDLYYAKYDPSGNYLWAKNLGMGSTDVGTALVLDSINNIYITGFLTK